MSRFVLDHITHAFHDPGDTPAAYYEEQAELEAALAYRQAQARFEEFEELSGESGNVFESDYWAVLAEEQERIMQDVESSMPSDSCFTDLVDRYAA